MEILCKYKPDGEFLIIDMNVPYLLKRGYLKWCLTTIHKFKGMYVGSAAQKMI
jgi:hypothetical protein